MKKLLVISLCVNAALLTGWLWQELPVAQGGPAKVATENGDVNGDTFRDIGDALYILHWLFNSGPEPMPVEPPVLTERIEELEAQLAAAQTELATCNSNLAATQAELAECRAGNCPPAKLLPDTGQTLCYDRSGRAIDCASDTCAGQDGRYATGCPSEDRFIDNEDGTVTDTCTGLMWQKDTGNNGNVLNWCDALAYCENLILAGHEDWRLPNVRELQSIVDYERFPSSSINPVFGALSSFYWSSTSFANFPDFAWVVAFNDGSVKFGGKGVFFLVRAVRTGP